MAESLRDRLLSRERPVAFYPCRVAPVEETLDAERALAVARKVTLGVPESDKTAARKAKAALDKAQARRDSCYEQLRLQALPPAEFEALADAYPDAPDDADEQTKTRANEDYLHAVFLASVQGDLTDPEWTEFVQQHLSTGERNDLYNLSIAVNGRVRALDPSVPKG